MGNKRAAGRRAQRVRRRLRRAIEAAGTTYCVQCSKIVWPTLDEAKERVEKVISESGTRKPYLLDSYRCPNGMGWHIGHNYKLQWISLCIGEHK
jgi:hypothetical protein